MDVNPLDIQPHTSRDTPPRGVTILGSTGSIGCNTVELIENNLERYTVEALTANRNVDLLADQARRLKSKTAVLADPAGYKDLKKALSGTGIHVAAGPEAVVEAAEQPADWVMASIVGAAGLKPTLSAVRRGATIGLANKECLVSAGDVFVREVGDYNATLLPVDSEHSAIFQVFDFDNAERVHRVILTASGGPFREFTREQMANVTPEQAVAHPNWDMGAKISVDSATMMNKGLELIEAFHLFPVSGEQIEILVHPQSVIHSMVDYVDGSVLAQLGTPDMRTPIAYALAWPQRMSTSASRLQLEDIATLTFEAPDTERFPALRLARQALETGGAAPTILNAANEVAVSYFLTNSIGFLDIVRIVEETLSAATGGKLGNLDDVAEADAEARRIAEDLVAGL
ncbi:MAG: 1-deoxy-D-xylulose-5-phosphate reductoisomerase [Rhodospirillales bacterium]|nr:1-deoxy-D-xylulose-5-phosphate reductoisomerase [Alphaproteobacteria bacterium]MBL6947844.1 1-deoxy-D-xylulose-5-phosphate reductoisomerase [Rhodospirillales bacterium]